MPEILTFLTLNDQAEHAAKLYTSIFPNSRITRTSHYPEGAGPPDAPIPAGTVMTVEFELDGRKFIALNGGPQSTFSQGISISLQCETQDEVDHYWNKLTEGGEEIACGWLTDKFGMSWQINPTILMDRVTDADPAKAKKAMDAMMQMVKIDSEQLKSAWA